LGRKRQRDALQQTQGRQFHRKNGGLKCHGFEKSKGGSSGEGKTFLEQGRRRGDPGISKPKKKEKLEQFEVGSLVSRKRKKTHKEGSSSLGKKRNRIPSFLGFLTKKTKDHAFPIQGTPGVAPTATRCVTKYMGKGK